MWMLLIGFFFVLAMSDFRYKEHDLCDITMHTYILHQLQFKNSYVSVSLADIVLVQNSMWNIILMESNLKYCMLRLQAMFFIVIKGRNRITINWLFVLFDLCWKKLKWSVLLLWNAGLEKMEVAFAFLPVKFEKELYLLQ